ncbi:MAG: hypothetical protein ACKV2T_27960 [Kofleriaceae bacterium]
MRLFGILIAIGVLVLTACGGSDDSPPGPLARNFDDMFIADVDPSQQTGVLQSQTEWSKAKLENNKAQADFDEASSNLANVKNDQKAAQLGVDTAINNKKSAEQSADNNRINEAAKALRAAELQKKAADSRVKYHMAYRTWLAKHLRWTQENMYWKEAQYELAKSEVAKRNNKSPKGIDYNWFPKQADERGKRTEKARGKADGEKQRATSAREAWLKAQQTADQEAGRPSALPDPMAPKPAPVAPTPAPAPAPES